MMTPTTDEILKRFADNLRSKDRQAATVESYCRDATEFLRYLDSFKMQLKSVEPETLIAFRDHLAFSEKDRDNSVRRKIIGIRQFFRFLAFEKLIGDTPFDAMPLPERDDELKMPIVSGQIESALLSMQATHLKSARDIAILRLLAFEGIKAHELIEFQINDYIASSGKGSLFVPGVKSRTIMLAPETTEALMVYRDYFKAWVETRKSTQQAQFHWLFVSFKGKDGSLVLPQMTRHGLKFLLYELGERFKILNMNTENLRHYAIEHLLVQGWDAEQIMAHLGLRRLGNIAKHMARRRQDS
ncbi:MAG: site-specific integrase [Oligoflexus sp.]|nr:site-specific integrase [Oligoflexus sp.]